jgi:alanine racemase
MAARRTAGAEPLSSAADRPARPSIDAGLAAAGLPPLPRTAWLEIDVDALAANLAAIRSVAGPGVRVEPVVKADAYGHGMIPVARVLEAAGADGLCVAAFDEAAALRAAGVNVPILVLFPVPPAVVELAAGLGISVAVGDGPLLDRLLGAAANLAPGTGSLGLHLEIETGLGRGGVAPDSAAAVAARIRAAPGVRLEGIWSHLQAAEDDARTAGQVERFDAAWRTVEGSADAHPPRHLVASGGLLADVGRYEAIRPGLTIYGLQPDELLGDPAIERLVLRPVLALRARPVRVADLPAGWGISYGPTFVTSRPSRIATLPLGYGDGWPRSLSNRAEALVRGIRVPLVGNVAMDAVMADVTDVPGPPIDVDDEFTLIGTQRGATIGAHEVARSRTTNAWEVVTAMSRRLPRVYDAAAGPVGVRTLGDAEGAWLGSNSGTATSAISRSTRS